MTSASIGIVSIGEMGFGFAKLLLAHDYRVVTNIAGRSERTSLRAKSAGLELASTDLELCNVTDYILSIVPPRDAISTAKRMIDASNAAGFQARSRPRYYVDLNAISPRCAREIEALFSSCPHFKYVDGGIIGGPPSLKEDGQWTVPSVPVSGPFDISKAEPAGQHIAKVLNMRHINGTIGSATGLKMCFASLSKGFTALAIQSFTAAEALGVTGELKEHLDKYSPGVRSRAERGLMSMPSKAYRWVNEMEHIGETFQDDGGFGEDSNVFDRIATVYQLVANSALGKGEVKAETADDVGKHLLKDNQERHD